MLTEVCKWRKRMRNRRRRRRRERNSTWLNKKV